MRSALVFSFLIVPLATALLIGGIVYLSIGLGQHMACGVR